MYAIGIGFMYDIRCTLNVMYFIYINEIKDEAT